MKTSCLIFALATGAASGASFFGSDNFANTANFAVQTWEWSDSGPPASPNQIGFVASNNKFHFISDGTAGHGLINAWWKNPSPTTTEPLSRTESWVLKVTATINVVPTANQQAALWVDVFDSRAYGSLAYDAPHADAIEVALVRNPGLDDTIYSGVEVGDTDSSPDVTKPVTQVSNVQIQVSYDATAGTISTGYSYDHGITMHVLGTYSASRFFNDPGDSVNNPEGGFVVALGAEADSIAIAPSQAYFSEFSITKIPASPLSIESAIALKLQSVLGKTYIIQESTDLVNWVDSIVNIQGTGSELVLYKEITYPKKFYRIKP